MDFVVEISTFQKNFEICSVGVEWSKTILWDPGGCFGTAVDQLGWIRNILEEKNFLMSETSFWANFCIQISERNGFVSQSTFL